MYSFILILIYKNKFSHWPSFIRDSFVFVTLMATWVEMERDREQARGIAKEIRLSRVTDIVRPRL